MRVPKLLSPALIVLLFAGTRIAAQELPLDSRALESAISTSGSFSLIPIDSWSSGDFDALSDSFWGYSTPRTNQLRVAMDQTATTTYEGDLFLRKLRLKLGLNIDVDNNFIGKLNRLMGYINYSGFSLRVQSSELRGSAYWTGDQSLATSIGMPTQSSFDNAFLSVDLLYYSKKDASMYYGLGYSSYRLPVQLDCLIYDTSRGEVWWAGQGALYQPDMAFHIYSALFGIDTLHGAFEKTGSFGPAQGFGLWMATQDRAGVGLSSISDEAKHWVEQANSSETKGLWSAEQIAMLVDYNLTLGLQWVGNLGGVRLGFGLGYNLGGQILTCITPKGPVEAGWVDASPSVYLFHHGPVIKGTVSW